MRYSLILLVLAVLLSLGIRFLADPIRQAQMTANPAHDLQELVTHDPVLGQALQQADQGNLSALTAWINRAEFEDRYRLALLLERISCRNDGSAKKDVVDIRVAYHYLNRFRAFTNLSTGDVRLDNELDNLLAYTLVTAHVHPSAADLALAMSLVPRLRNIPASDSSDGFLDTIGCVEYQAGNYDEAKDAFASALHIATQSHETHSRQSLSFYQRRLDAAVHNAQLKEAAQAHPEGPPPAYRELPPDEDAADAPALLASGAAAASTTSTAITGASATTAAVAGTDGASTFAAAAPAAATVPAPAPAAGSATPTVQSAPGATSTP